MKEKIQAVIEYLEDLQDAELHPGDSCYSPNEEMTLLIGLEEYKKCSENLLTLAVLFIQKAHHHDGCHKARENWKECTCGKDRFLKLVKQISVVL